MQQKKCGRCKQVKDISEFTRANSCYCGDCQREYCRNYQRKKERVDRRYYAIYKGDEFICMGNREECAEYLGVKKHTITFWSSPAHKKRTAHSKDPFLAIVVEED